MYLDGGLKPGNFQPNVLRKQGGKIFALAKCDFATQSNPMNPNWAEENLQTIRTLMERSAVYRRALAPIMLLAGVMGVVAAMVGLLGHLDSVRVFCAFWLGTAAIAVAGAFLIARQQAIKDKEAFWSPPTRRVAQTMWPLLLAGAVLGGTPMVGGGGDAPPDCDSLTAIIWILFYGCALHAAGFFMPRGINLFGLLFMAFACGLFYAFFAGWISERINAHLLMGFFFGVLHLAYGIYLYLTEKGKRAA
jgi:hypothetical protein